MDHNKPSSDILHQAITDFTEPVVFNNIINIKNKNNNWHLLSLENLVEKIKHKSLPFRVGKNSKTNGPQWEFSCTTEKMTLPEFLERNSTRNSQDEWHYFDYKYMHEWFEDEPELLEAVNWQAFGFDKSGRDSTLWIGSKGAHTNCHQDSYGCNLIAQIHGRKEWLLFPPDTGHFLKQTRVPYEESTVYSKFNFFCPSKDDEEAIMKVDKMPILVTLEPGQVLFVPKGWWHYVESLELSVSINIWLPLDSDCEARLKEALVKLIMTRLGEELPSADNSQYTLEESIKLIENCLEECNETSLDSSAQSSQKRMKKTKWTVKELASEYPSFVKNLNVLSVEELKTLLVSKQERFHNTDDTCEAIKGPENDESSFHTVLEAVVDSICHSDIIDRIADMLLIDK